MRILVISDLHIKNNVRHEEYSVYFDYILKKILENEPDFIVFCGDLFHSKTTLSPDSFVYAYKFLKMLGICVNTRVVILAGNHDMNEKNLDKLDAISPLIEHLDSSRYTYTKTASDVDFGNIVFRPYPLTDKENWKFDRNHDKIMVGLYHGPLNGVKTDLGFVFTEGRDVKEFECCDYLFCGDIHSITDYTENGSKISVGNPIQQDFGEDTKKGMWLYDIQSRTSFSRRFIEIPNYYPFMTLKVGDSIPYLAAAKKVRFRIFSDSSHEETIEYVKRIKDIFQNRILSLTSSKTPAANIEEAVSRILTYEEYIADKVNREQLLQLYSRYIKEVEDIYSPNNWKIKTISWDNMLSYAENNSIDFREMEEKSIGIFGKNYSGKTSIIDIICFGLYGSWTKSFVKLINLVNDKKKSGQITIVLQINNKEYKIQRILEKSGKNCKHSLFFENMTDNEKLNDLDVGKTQAVIESYIGTKSQFLLTSLSSQFNNFSLLDEKNTKRKEYFSSFLGITKYEQIYKIVKNDIKTLKDEISAHSKFSNVENINAKIAILDSEIEEAISEINSLDKKLEILALVDKTYHKTILKNKELRNNAKFIEQQYSSKLERNNKKIDSLSKEISIDLGSVESIDSFIEVSSFYDEIDLLSTRLLSDKNTLDKYVEAKKLLASVPCGTQFINCRFITNSKEYLNVDGDMLETRMGLLNKELEEVRENLKKAEIHNKLVKKNVDKAKEIEKQVQKNLLVKAQIETLIKERKEDIEEYELVVSKLKQLENLVHDDEVKEKEIEKAIQDELSFHKLKIAFEGRKKVADLQKAELLSVLEAVSEKQLSLMYLEEFAETVGKNGIIVSILNQYIPAITEYVNNILLNFVEFKISIDIENDKDVEIYIEDSFSSRLVETCSGSQMTIISYALRMALLHYCQIPSCNLVIMDEPATALDADHLSEFSKLLDMIKLDKKTILVVTHIMMLKDFMDVSLLVDKSSEYSKIIG